MRGIVLFFLLSGMLTACGSNSGDKESVETKANAEKSSGSQTLQIVTTIKPVQSIVLAILGDQLEGKTNSFQLIPDYSSPHSASFKPSDIRKVSKADVIFRIDEHMEIMLNPLFEKHQKKLVSLAEIEGMGLIDWDSLNKARSKIFKEIAAESANHEHSHEVEEEKPVIAVEEKAPEKQDNHEQHVHTKQDMHIWTSPKNALLMAKHVTKVLSELDAKNQDIYEKNLASFGEKLAQESMEISQKLNNKIGKPYIVFHNSWQYFAHEFGLADPIVLNIQEGLTSGAKKLSETRDLISELKVRCVFTDSSISQAQVDTLLSNQKGVDIRVFEIDVLGRKIEPSQDAYLSWLKDMGMSISKCL